MTTKMRRLCEKGLSQGEKGQTKARKLDDTHNENFLWYSSACLMDSDLFVFVSFNLFVWSMACLLIMSSVINLLLIFEEFEKGIANIG